MELMKYEHCIVGANLHLQFTPAYRRDIFCDSVITTACRNLFYEVARTLDVDIVACAFGPDHTHVFISGWKNYSIAYLAQRFKGRSSYVIRKCFWERVKPKLWGKKFWSGGYFAETVGRVTSETIKYYIERQQGRHWKSEKHELLLGEEEPEDVFQLKLNVFPS